MNKVTLFLKYFVVLFLYSSCAAPADQAVGKGVNAFLSLIGSCAEYIETGSLKAFVNLKQVPIEPEDCALDCKFGSAKYVSPKAPNAGYLRVLTPDPNFSQSRATETGVSANPETTRCLVKPAKTLGRTPGSELNNAVQKARQMALKEKRIVSSTRERYWNDGCGFNGLTYQVETISFSVQGSDQRILHFVQFHFPGLYYDGPMDLHGNPLGPLETKTCVEVGF